MRALTAPMPLLHLLLNSRHGWLPVYLNTDLKSGPAGVDWWSLDHFLLPGHEVTDVSNSLGRRHIIHKQRHKDSDLLQSAGKHYANKKSCDNTVPPCPDLPAFDDRQEKPLSTCWPDIKSSRGTACTVCNCSLVLALATGEQHVREPWALCPFLTQPPCT